jgi:hypothetical protein
MTGRHRAPEPPAAAIGGCSEDVRRCPDDVCRTSGVCAWPAGGEPDPGDLIPVSRSALLAAVPCECGPHYAERGLIAPDCRHHDVLAVIGDLP